MRICLLSKIPQTKRVEPDKASSAESGAGAPLTQQDSSEASLNQTQVSQSQHEDH